MTSDTPPDPVGPIEEDVEPAEGLDVQFGEQTLRPSDETPLQIVTHATGISSNYDLSTDKNHVDLANAESAFDEANRVPPPVGGLIRPRTTTERREDTRSRLAYWVMGLLTVIVGVGLWGWIDGVSRDRLEDLTLMFSPVVTLMATVLGFYFASRDS